MNGNVKLGRAAAARSGGWAQHFFQMLLVQHVWPGGMMVKAPAGLLYSLERSPVRLPAFSLLGSDTVPRTHTRLGDRSFSAAGPRI